MLANKCRIPPRSGASTIFRRGSVDRLPSALAPSLLLSPGPMGISMLLYLAHDSDLRAFTGAPRTLQVWLRYPHSIPPVSLHEYWQDLDAILAGEPSERSKSRLRPQEADWTYPFVADRGAHALSSISTEQLLHSIELVARPQVEAYVRQRWVAKAVKTGEVPELAPAQVSLGTEELLVHLARLRESCALAVSKGYGLLMALWEESS
jgi:hypothetical protein